MIIAQYAGCAAPWEHAPSKLHADGLPPYPRESGPPNH